MLTIFKVIRYYFGGYMIIGNKNIKTIWPTAFNETENQKYLMLLRSGEERNKDIRNILIEHNIRYVCYIASSYAQISCNSYDVEDMISHGIIGLISAIDNFNPDCGTKFATFASVCIHNKIRRYLKKTTTNNYHMISLNEIINSEADEKEMALLEVLSDEEKCYEHIELEETYEELRESLPILFDIEQKVIEMRYGIDCVPMNQQQIAKTLNLSQPYISRIEKRARAKIKEFMQNKEFFAENGINLQRSLVKNKKDF